MERKDVDSSELQETISPPLLTDSSKTSRRRSSSLRRLNTPFVANGYDLPRAPLWSPSSEGILTYVLPPSPSPSAGVPQRDEKRQSFSNEEGFGDDSGPGCKITMLRALASLGVVYGDIGTSPLYVFTATFHSHVMDKKLLPTEADILGVLSMLIWSLILVVCVKYLGFILRADFEGEGGVFCLLKQLPKEKMSRFAYSTAVVITMWGGALVLGDGAITPAISVLSAVQGLTVQYPDLASAVIPISAFLLLVLFLLQRWGTECVGKLFGPFMLVWFVTLAIAGGINLSRYGVSACKALSPHHAIMWWLSGNYRGAEAWKALGGVVLSLTGAEALFADLGHFGRLPIYISWFGVVLISLILQYCGQAAYLIHLANTASDETLTRAFSSVFWNSNPYELYYPFLVLAPLATFIASQAVISGCFSLVSQASALELAPRVNVIHTSEHQMGEVFVPEINFILGVICISLVFGFQTSEALAGAYGVAVTSAFLIDSIMFSLVAVLVWEWPWAKAFLLVSVWFLLDILFWTSNLLKIPQGGWFPIAIGLVVFTIMATWAWGRSQESIHDEVRSAITKLGSVYSGAHKAPRSPASFSTVNELIQALKQNDIARSPGVGIFLTRHVGRVPRALSKLLLRIGALPKCSIILTVEVCDEPFVGDFRRVDVKCLDVEYELYVVVIHRGWAEPLSALNVPILLKDAKLYGHETNDRIEVLDRLDMSHPDVEITLANCPDEPVTFYLNLSRFKPHPRKSMCHKMLCEYYNLLQSISVDPVQFFKLPVGNCVEVGTVIYL